MSLPAGGLTPPPGGYRPVGTWNREAVGNAAIIVGVGAHMGVPVRGWIIAVATAIQESSLINLPDLGDENNADSLGLFQQRPSQGWGTPAQIMDPVYASTKFYEHLLAVPGWQSMSLTEAAQAVQRPVGADATRIVAALTGSANPADPSALAAACDPTTLQAIPSGFTLPPDTPPAVTAAIVWAFAQLGTPYSFGGDCTNAHGGDPAHQCDCSSLMQQAYKAGGITLPRTSQDQFHAGAPVPDITGLRPGDLVFVPGADGTMTAPGHVGMYLGNGLIIDAPTTGQNVHIGQLAPYWTGNLAGIRRVA
jgi:cell wall-associated NlpC family hydrolase